MPTFSRLLITSTQQNKQKQECQIATASNPPPPSLRRAGKKVVKVPLARCATSVAFVLAAMTTLAATSPSPSAASASTFAAMRARGGSSGSGNALTFIRFADAITSDLDDVVDAAAEIVARSPSNSDSEPHYSKENNYNNNNEGNEEEEDYDADFNDALGSRQQQQQQDRGNERSVEQQQDGEDNENGGEEEENPDEIDYTDTNDDGDMNNNKKNALSDGRRRRRAPGDNGVLPQLAEQAERLAEQSRQLSENADIFKGEVSVISLLPKKLLDTSKRLSVLAAQPAYKTSQLMFSTQAKRLKEQSKRIQDIVFQLHERIPEYALESQKLATQSDGVRGVAEQNVLQGIDPEDPSVLELRREVKVLEKEYAKTLRKSQELRRNLKQLTEQAESVNKIAAALPDNGGDRDPSVTSDTEDLLHAGEKARAAAAAAKKKMVKSASASVSSGSSSASVSSE